VLGDGTVWARALRLYSGEALHQGQSLLSIVTMLVT